MLYFQAATAESVKKKRNKGKETKKAKRNAKE